MPGHCCVPRCMGKGGFKFPSDKEQRRKWIVAVKRGESNWAPSKWTKVCKKHFNVNDFSLKTREGDVALRSMLKEGSIPSIFDWSSLPTPSQTQRAEQATNSQDGISAYLNIGAEVDALNHEDQMTDITMDTSTHTNESIAVSNQDKSVQNAEPRGMQASDYAKDLVAFHYYTGLESTKQENNPLSVESYVGLHIDTTKKSTTVMMRSEDTAYSPKKVPKTDLITPKRQTRTSTGAITTPTFINLDSDSDDEDVKLISVEKPVIPPKLGGRVQVRWPAAPHLRPMAPRQQISQIRSPAPIVVNVDSEGFKRTNKVSRSQTKATHFIPDIELLMECTDEPLSAAQLVKAKQAHTAHFTSREAIKLLKAQSNCTVEEVSPGIEKLVVYDKPMTVPKILGPRANTFSSNVRPSKPLMPVISSVHSMAPTLPTDNAMILRFENGYPKLVPAGRLPAFSLAQPINNCQILMSSGTTLVPANTVLSSTQYPSTLTSPVVGSSMATLTSVTPRDHSILKMSLMPNANVSSKPKMSAKEADQGYSLKRQLSLGPSVDAKRLKSTPRVNWVPLSEYYYGRLEGDPTYFEEKYSTAGTEIRFKCFHCEKMLYNNLQVMVHVQNHMDAEKQQNMDLNHLTLCSHCYVQFDTPFEKQQHVDTVHQEDSAAVVCRICEQDMGDETTLAAHMKSRHCKSEMPYCCQLCQFRSSFYADVIDHFKKRHDGSQFFLCLYCLKVVRSAMLGNSAFSGNTRYYFQHLQKHQSKRNHGSKCPSCKLIFTSRQEVDAHR